MSRDSIRARVEAATPGPWEWDDPYVLGQAPPDGMVVTYIYQFDTKPANHDRAFIAAARQDIPALLRIADTADALATTLGSVEFRANFFGLTCSPEDSKRIAVAVDAYHVALRDLEALP